MKNRNAKASKRSIMRRAAGLILAVVVFGGSIGLTNFAMFGAKEVYAKTIGEKNKQACDNCDAVVNGKAPTGQDYDDKAGAYVGEKYDYEKLLNGAVYRGGNSKSVLSNGTVLDNDPDDFAAVLPYGTVYIDSSKINWDDPEGFLIDIPQNETRFKWVATSEASASITDKGNHSPTQKPLGESAGVVTKTQAPDNTQIAYVGPLNAYLDNINDPATETPKAANQNIFTPVDGADYLYRITYYDAATLPDGTKGDLVFTATRVEFETSFDCNSPVVVGMMHANEMKLNVSYQSGGAYMLKEYDQPVGTVDKFTYTKTDGKSATVTAGQADVRGATGMEIDFDFKVTDKQGNPVEGSILYAAYDLDFRNFQELWGRSLTGANRNKFNEAVTINNGALSYAVTPKYDPLDKKPTTTETGWAPVGPGEAETDSPLKVIGGGGTTANGVTFTNDRASKVRNANGTFTDKNGKINVAFVPGNKHINPSAQNNHPWVIGINRTTNPVSLQVNDHNNIRAMKAYAAKILGKTQAQVTDNELMKTLGYSVERNDGNTYDSGFAVLLDSRSSSLTWSGSAMNGSNAVGTDLFKTTLFTSVEMTHGTGGGIYFETYNLNDNCLVRRNEGTTTMGRGVDATVTAVPEDGYRVQTIRIGGAGLANPKTYDVDTLTFTGGIYEDAANGVTIEKNSDGTYDVTFANMQDARHVHVDFSADYYFYKVWKGEKEPTSLNMTATPFAFVFKDVKIEGTKYKISNHGNTFTDPAGTAYMLENNSFSVGEGADTVTYYLEGNSLVTYKVNQETGKREKDKTYDIRLDYEQNGDPVKFTVKEEDARNASETHVTEGTEDDYTMWKITYPAEGYTTKGGSTWPALPIETEASAHNINHVERNYWFVTEEAPGWALVSYDNSKAEAPGKTDAATSRNEVYKEGEDGDLSAWAYASTKDYSQAEAVIRDAADNDHAYMSVFNTEDGDYSWGGKIVNVPAVVVNAEKTWKDFSDAYETRQDVWFHIDVQASGGTKIEDFLPPQKLAADATGGKTNDDSEANSRFTLTWGDKEAYGDSDLGEYKGDDYSKVKVVGTAADIPRTDKDGNPLYYKQDENYSHKYLPMLVDGLDREGKPVYVPDPDGVTYYVNELEDKNSADKKYTFFIRETDAEGNELYKADPTEFLYGYKSTVGDVEKDDEQATLDGVKVDSYTGKVTNTLETADFTVKKVWVDGDNAENKRPEDGTVTYSIKKQPEGGSQSALETLPVEKSATQGTADVTSDYANGKIAVKTNNGDTVEFSKLPKYDTKGRELTYTVEETAIDGYKTEITGDMKNGYTVTNTQKTDFFVEKAWDDANNQDGVRLKSVTFELLKDETETGTTLDLSESNNWKGKFSNLDKYDKTTNEPIIYSAQEDVATTTAAAKVNYEVTGRSGSGTENDPYKITNFKEPEKITIKATKVWNDTGENPGDKYGIRFEAEFILMGDGVQVGEAKTVANGDNHDQNMTATWEVDKYRNGGQTIIYNVIENKDLTSPYSVEVAGNVTEGFTVTNVYPPKTEYKTVTRTITYTYLKPDGKKIYDTVVQTVELKRNPLVWIEDEKKYVWSPWEFSETDPDKRNTKGVESPTTIDGWTPAMGEVDPWVINIENPENVYVNVTYNPSPPTPKGDETYGAPGQEQTGKPEFEVGTKTTPDGSKNKIVDYKLIDPKTGKPTDAKTLDAFESGKKVGTYTLNEDGSITFKPDDSTYTGNPDPVKIQGTDSNGQYAVAEYKPHIIPNTKTVKRTIHYRYLTEDGTEVTTDVEHDYTFTDGDVNPVDGTVSWPPETKGTMPAVSSPSVDGYTPDKESVPVLEVTPTDGDTEVTVVYLPKGIAPEPDETYGLPGQSQTGEPSFTMETPKLPDGTDNALTIKLIDPDTGEVTDATTVNAYDKVTGEKIGTYTLNPDGTVTFEPDDDTYVGDPEPLKLRATDLLGKTADTTYTPHIVKPSTEGTATRTIHYRYLTDDGEEVTGDTKQTVTLYKYATKIDPETGDPIEWGDWEPAKFPAVTNPDDRVDGREWFTDDSVGECEVTEPGELPDEFVIYETIPYKVTYFNGDHGTSDGKGNQTDETYGNDVTGGNGVTPEGGYKFTGKYTYVIKDRDGNIIEEGETDDPTTIPITGNIEFTPVYEKIQDPVAPGKNTTPNKTTPARTATAVSTAGQKSVGSVYTGDGFNPLIWITIISAALAVLMSCVSVLRRRKHR